MYEHILYTVPTVTDIRTLPLPIILDKAHDYYYFISCTNATNPNMKDEESYYSGFILNEALVSVPFILDSL